MVRASQLQRWLAVVVTSLACLPPALADEPSTPSAGRDAARIRVLVLPFESLSAEPEAEADAASVRALTRSLTFDLSALHSIHALPGDKVAPDAATARDQAVAEGARFVVWGTLQRAGDRVRVSGQVSDVDNDEGIAGRFKLTGQADDWFELQDAVSEQVERRIRAAMAVPDEAIQSGAEARQPVEVPPGEPLRVAPRWRGGRPDWAEPQGRPHERGVTRHYNYTRSPYRYSPFRYGISPWCHGRWYGRHHGYHHYGPGGLGSFDGAVPLRWYFE